MICPIKIKYNGFFTHHLCEIFPLDLFFYLIKTELQLISHQVSICGAEDIDAFFLSHIIPLLILGLHKPSGKPATGL